MVRNGNNLCKTVQEDKAVGCYNHSECPNSTPCGFEWVTTSQAVPGNLWSLSLCQEITRPPAKGQATARDSFKIQDSCEMSRIITYLRLRYQGTRTAQAAPAMGGSCWSSSETSAEQKWQWQHLSQSPEPRTQTELLLRTTSSLSLKG